MNLQQFLTTIPTQRDIYWLYDDQTIDDAAQLKENDLLMASSKMESVFKIRDLNIWRGRVKAKREKVLSHISIAKDFIALYGVEIIYTRGDWHKYTTGVWSVLPEFHFNKMLQPFLDALEDQYEIVFSTQKRNSIIGYIQDSTSIEEKYIDANPQIINLKNGMFNTVSQMLEPHDPKQYLTTQLPFEYDPDAKCPNWLQYLEGTFVRPIEPNEPVEFDSSLIGLLRQAVGYSLTLNTNREKMFLCIGEGSNGKGVLFHVLQELVGSASTPLDLSNLSSNQYQLATLAGMKIAFCTEADRNADAMLNDGQIKAIVSGDKMMVRQIRERPFVLKNTSKIWWSMNNLPHFSDTSHGMWRRMTIFPFNRIFSGNDVDLGLKEKLEAELSGIFNWAIEGLNSLNKNGWIESTQVNSLIKEHQVLTNSVKMFVSEMCESESKSNIKFHQTKVKANTIYSQYKLWCIDYSMRPKNVVNFKKEMQRLGHYWKKESNGRFYYGLELKKTDPFGIRNP